MHRKVQVFSMPAKVSIGQGRNKKDPQRGRKHFCSHLCKNINIIEIKKLPVGDGNAAGSVGSKASVPNR